MVCIFIFFVIESIDIGGPTLARGAAKNYHHVASVVDPHDYASVAQEIAQNGGLTLDRRLGLAQKVFSRMERYDGAVANFLGGE